MNNFNDIPAKVQIHSLMRGLEDDDMTNVRLALIELLDMKYSGDHATDIEPYKHSLVKMILTYFKAGIYHLANAFMWQLNELGVKWPELEVIRKSIESEKDS